MEPPEPERLETPALPVAVRDVVGGDSGGREAEFLTASLDLLSNSDRLDLQRRKLAQNKEAQASTRRRPQQTRAKNCEQREHNEDLPKQSGVVDMTESKPDKRMQLWSRPAARPIMLNEQAIINNLTDYNVTRMWPNRRAGEDERLYLVHNQGTAGINTRYPLIVKKFQNVNPTLRVDGNVRYRYKSEMILLASNSHDNIIKVVDLIQREDAIMLVYEYPNFNAVIASFGDAQMNMAGLGQPLPITDLPPGNFGYAAPEYGNTASPMTEKVDTYSFGVLLLVLVTGREPNGAGADGHLAVWARNFAQLTANQREIFEGAVDMVIPDQARYMEEMATVFRLGVDCTAVDPQQRPSMRMALKRLRGSRWRGPFRGLLACYLLVTFYIYIPSVD
uniref:Receptor-like protein kinase 5 n=1 Tax=Aegilops tauschii TaxID=37682 RepID=M8CKR2_AEGTA